MVLAEMEWVAMTVIFIWPLAFSVIAAMHLTSPEYGLGIKLTVWSLVLVSLALQFVEPLPQLVHFGVPLALQLIVAGIWFFRENFEGA